MILILLGPGGICPDYNNDKDQDSDDYDNGDYFYLSLIIGNDVYGDDDGDDDDDDNDDYGSVAPQWHLSAWQVFDLYAPHPHWVSVSPIHRNSLESILHIIANCKAMLDNM